MSLSKVTIPCLIYLFLTAVVITAKGASDPNVAIIHPEAAPGPLDNPLKGYCVYTDAGKIHRPYSMVYFYVPWKKLEPEQGRYAFAKWEKEAWNIPEAKGKHVVLRVYADYPRKPSGTPEWLLEKGVKQKAYKDYGGGLSPEYDHPAMVTALEGLISAMGKRYDRHPRVAFIQLGLLGFWGEWHTYPRDELFASEKTRRRILEAYRKAFPNKLLMARYADGLPGRYPKMGFHDDMFPEDTDNGKSWSFLERLRRAKRIDSWQTSVIGGEMVPQQARKWLGDRWEFTLEMTRRSHFSWVGPYGPALQDKVSSQFVARSDELVRQMGYQFRLTEVRLPQKAKTGQSVEVIIHGINEGVAPFYYSWPVKLAWLDADGNTVVSSELSEDLRKWLPGRFSIGANLDAPTNKGSYRLALGIEDPWTHKPAIRFANNLTVAQGWTVLGSVLIE